MLISAGIIMLPSQATSNQYRILKGPLITGTGSGQTRTNEVLGVYPFDNALRGVAFVRGGHNGEFEFVNWEGGTLHSDFNGTWIRS